MRPVISSVFTQTHGDDTDLDKHSRVFGFHVPKPSVPGGHSQREEHVLSNVASTEPDTGGRSCVYSLSDRRKEKELAPWGGGRQIPPPPRVCVRGGDGEPEGRHQPSLSGRPGLPAGAGMSGRFPS